MRRLSKGYDKLLLQVYAPGPVSAMTAFPIKRMWIALYMVAGLFFATLLGIAIVLVTTVEDWSRDLSVNVATTDANSADERLRPIHSSLPPGKIAERVEAAAAALPRWELASREENAAAEEQAVLLHFIRTTPLMRFKDDIRVRIEAAPDGGSVLTAESRSRVGKGDLGQNPRNLRELLGSPALKANE
jgi:uncharacterized protein (DUF1499 family)